MTRLVDWRVGENALSRFRPNPGVARTLAFNHLISQNFRSFTQLPVRICPR